MLELPIATLSQQLELHLDILSTQIGPRPSCSSANHAAAEYIQAIFKQCDLDVEMQTFPCPSWEDQGTIIELGGNLLAGAANAYSPACDVTASTVAAGTLAELETADLMDHIAVLYGDLVMAPIACKSWFLKSEQDDRVVQLLEEKQPAAIITINAGPGKLERLIEDWEFNIPSATVPADTGLSIMANLGLPMHLKIETVRASTNTSNVVARKNGTRQERIVFMAHYDTKIDTPGALDSASGVAVLLALAQTLSRRELPIGMEWIAFTNEEYLPIGDDEYMRRYDSTLNDIEVAINFDGVGQRLSVNSIAIYTNSQAFKERVGQIKSKYPGIVWVDPWPESNHSSFSWRGVPCLAFTSRSRTRIAHLRSDTVDLVDPRRLAELVSFVSEFVESIQYDPKGWTRPKE